MKKTKFGSNGVFHAMQKTGFVGAGVGGRHRFDLGELERRKKASDEKPGKKRAAVEDEEPDQDEIDPMALDGDVDDMPMPHATPKMHAKKIAKHAKTLRKIAVDIGDRVSEMHKMGLS